MNDLTVAIESMPGERWDKCWVCFFVALLKYSMHLLTGMGNTISGLPGSTSESGMRGRLTSASCSNCQNNCCLLRTGVWHIQRQYRYIHVLLFSKLSIEKFDADFTHKSNNTIIIQYVPDHCWHLSLMKTCKWDSFQLRKRLIYLRCNSAWTEVYTNPNMHLPESDIDL